MKLGITTEKSTTTAAVNV